MYALAIDNRQLDVAIKWCSVDGHPSLQAYLGHRNIQNTTRYTALAPDRFKSFWRD
jgi:hypothetical protein